MSDNLTLGLMMAELEESHRPKLNEIMSRFGGLKEYWVLVACVWIGNELHRRFMVFSRPPVQGRYNTPFQATICYYRNNSWVDDREIKRIWCLPKDFPFPDQVLVEGAPASPHLEDDAKRLGVPIIY